MTKSATRQANFDPKGVEDASLYTLAQKGLTPQKLLALPNHESLLRQLNETTRMVREGFPISRLGELTTAEHPDQRHDVIPMGVFAEAYHNRVDPAEVVRVTKSHGLQCSNDPMRSASVQKVHGDLPQYLRARYSGAKPQEAEEALRLLKPFRDQSTGVIPIKVYANHRAFGGTHDEFKDTLSEFQMGTRDPVHFLKQYTALRGLGQDHDTSREAVYNTAEKGYNFDHLLRTVRNGGTVDEFNDAAQKLGGKTNNYSMLRRYGVQHQRALDTVTGQTTRTPTPSSDIDLSDL